ncbi:MAG: arginine--tRNA ligase [Candidatus Eisenbacteria bacterium]|nr:arginine--tRNA ligase [Candidatus Eisenbacteria bacterium]
MFFEELKQALAGALASLGLPADRAEVTPPRDPSHGDAGTSVALALAKELGRNPRELAAEIVAALDRDPSVVESVEVAGPGFINFRLAAAWYERVLREAVKRGGAYGRSDAGRGARAQVEFVSANPTGPLNIVSARAAAVGDAIANLLAGTGVEVEREYYVNDGGQQVEKLALSVEARIRASRGEPLEIPEGGYHGDYLCDVAAAIAAERPDVLAMPRPERLAFLKAAAVRAIVSQQKADLERFGVRFDRWFYESELGAAVDAARERLVASGETFEQDGAVWLRTTPHGTNDDKVIVKSDGQPTYLLPDVAYHLDKFARGFDPVIDLWGPDHHAHVAEVHAALEILGYPQSRLEIQIVQQVNFIEGGKQLKMSKRAGRLVTLGELVDDVGVDVAKFFFLMRTQSAHLDFDLDLARQQTEENPVFYVQYAHARVASLIRFAKDRGHAVPSPEEAVLGDVSAGDARRLVLRLSDFPALVDGAARAREPHRLTAYLREVAAAYHSYYHNNRIVTDDPAQTAARLFLSEATKTVLRSGLLLLGLSAPERM